MVQIDFHDMYDNTKTIYIIGAGAIGRTLAVCLVEAGRRVVLIRGRNDNQSVQKEPIHIIMPHNVLLHETVEIKALQDFSSLDGVIVLCNKSYGNEDLAMRLRQKIVGTSPIVILQNGLDVEIPFLHLDFPSVYRCVLFATSQLTDDGKISFKPVSVSLIGSIKGTQSGLEEIVGCLNCEYFRFGSIDNIQPVIWKKSIINSVFNSVCPLLEVDNGVFQRNRHALNLARRIVNECIPVARRYNVILHAKEVMESLLLISGASDGQMISTLQDLKSGRETEIETLNFAIFNKAKLIGQEDLAKETRLLGELVKLKSNLSRNI